MQKIDELGNVKETVTKKSATHRTGQLTIKRRRAKRAVYEAFKRRLQFDTRARIYIRQTEATVSKHDLCC
jgi:hypothetical protein